MPQPLSVFGCVVKAKFIFTQKYLDNKDNRPQRTRESQDKLAFFVSSALARRHNGRVYGIRKAIYIRHI